MGEGRILRLADRYGEPRVTEYRGVATMSPIAYPTATPTPAMSQWMGWPDAWDTAAP